MKKYCVGIHVNGIVWVEVEAESMEEAMENAENENVDLNETDLNEYESYVVEDNETGEVKYCEEL